MEEVNQIWPLRSTLRKAAARADSNNGPALPARNLMWSSRSSSRCAPSQSMMNWADSESDSNPSSSVMKRSFKSGLNLWDG